MKNILLIVTIPLIIGACSSTVIPIKTLQKVDYKSRTQDFNETDLLGKWLTNYENNTTDFILFKKDKTFSNETNRNGTYEIKKDSIILNYPDTVAKGRLLEQTTDIMYILWGNVDVVTYHRPQ